MYSKCVCPALTAPEWCSHGDLNPKPSGYEPDALPIELCKHVDEKIYRKAVLLDAMSQHAVVLLSLNYCSDSSVVISD